MRTSLEGNCSSLSKYKVPASFSPALLLLVIYPQSLRNVSTCSVQCVSGILLNA